MNAIQLSGKIQSDHIKTHIKKSIQASQVNEQRLPKLVMILMGNHFASQVYLRHKEQACKQVGMISRTIQLSATYSENNLLQLIHKLNEDDSVDGILVQLPLPGAINTSKVLDTIDPLKDVDGFHPMNVGLLAQGRPFLRACTPYGIMRLLATLSTSLEGMHAVIVGASNIVGKPMMLELLRAQCTVTICHIATRDLVHHVRQADLLVSAIGKTNIIQSEWIKKGAIIVDAGINRTQTGITGDIEFRTAVQHAYAITPVPGGVGPMTVAMLLENTLTAYQSRMDTIAHAVKNTTS